MEYSMPNSSSDEEMKIWQKNAIEKQTFYCQVLGDRKWEKYTDNENDIIHLTNKIGFLLFGNPKRKGEIDINAKIIQLLEDDEIKPDFFEDFTKTDDKLCQDPSSGEQDQKFSKFAELLDNLFDFQCEMTTDSKQNSEDNDSHESDQHEVTTDFNLNPEDYDSDQSDDLNSSDSSLEDSDSGYANLVHVDSQEEKDTNMLYYTESAQISQINNLITAIRSCSDNNNLLIAFIFVIAKIENFNAEFRVIRVCHEQNKNKEDISYFVDATGRCYSSWDNFLKENLYPPCTYCYPKGGFYACDEDGNVFVDFDKSPGSKFVRKFNNAADVATVIGGIGCLLTVGVSLAVPFVFPAAAAFCGSVLAASSATGTGFGLWSTGRSVYQLIDKKLHKEKLADQEARSLWLNVATGILAGASLGALKYTQYAARTGKVLGKVAMPIINGIEYSTAVVAGGNVFNQIYNIYEKKTVTYSDTAGLVVSLLFFFNTAIALKDAEQILKESQSNVLDGIKSQLSRNQKKSFNKLIKDTTAGTNVVEGNACVIKTVQNIKDPKSYFRDLNRAAKTANKTKSRLSFNKDGSGKINVNNKVSVEPELLNSMSTKSQNKLFNSSKKFNKSDNYSRTFKKNMKLISKKENLEFNRETFEFKGKQQAKTDIKLTPENKLPFVKPAANTSCSKISAVRLKKKVEEHELQYELIEIFYKISDGLRKFNEGKEMYDFLMDYYKKNLKEKFEKLIENKASHIIDMVSKIYETDKKNFVTRKREFYRTIENKNNLTPWDYFKTYFPKMFMFVPDRKSVDIVPNDVGWMFKLSDKSRRIDFVFMAAMRIDSDIEKILAIAFMQ